LKGGEVMIELSKIGHSYGAKEVLKNINLKITPGEAIGIIGRNGAGKSTLIDIIAGMKKPSKGMVNYDFSIKELPKKIGIQLQQAQFDGRLNVEDWCKFWASMYGIPKSRVEELLSYLELSELKKQNIEKLSGGQKQKLNILCAMLHDPEMLIFDELTTGLDAISRKDIRRKLKSLKNAGKTIVMVSHYMEELEDLCERFVIIKEGCIIEDTNLETLKNKYKVSSLEQCFDKIMDNDSLEGGAA
jgi:ABC-2 type transport system ATP-binding protein